jgi:hypothetical protein
MTTGLKTGARTSHRHWSTASAAPLSGRDLHKISIGRRRPGDAA